MFRIINVYQCNEWGQYPKYGGGRLHGWMGLSVQCAIMRGASCIKWKNTFDRWRKHSWALLSMNGLLVKRRIHVPFDWNIGARFWVMRRQRTKLKKLGWRQLGLTVDKWDHFLSILIRIRSVAHSNSWWRPLPPEASFVGSSHTVAESMRS